jgi:hypothetical protein
VPIFAGIGVAIQGIISSFFTVAGLTSAALQLAAGIGLSYIAAAIKGGAKQEYAGIQGTLQTGGDTPRSFILGTYNTAGSLAYHNAYHQASDTPNALYAQVVALSDMPIQAITEYWLDGQKLDVRAATSQYGDYSNDHISNGDQHLWFRFYNGTQTAADTELVNGLATSERPYGSDRIGYGVSYVIVTALMDRRDNENPMFKGFPQPKFTVTGIPLYDISKDSTAGGSGSHRYSDPSTWGGDGDNLPAVQIYNILRGITYGGKWLYGLQSPNPAILPAANWIAAINKCRASVDGPDGPEPQYRSGAQVDVDLAPADIIETLLKTCAGRLTEVGGTYTIHVGEPDAPVLSFTDGDILSTEEQTYDPFRGLSDSINGAVATYPEPAEGWNQKTSPAVNNPQQEVRDGNRRLMSSVDLSACPYKGQVQRLLKSAMLEAVRERRHTIVLPPWAQCLEPGDVVEWTSDRNGYEAKWFRIDGISYKANLDVMVQLTEVDPSDYDWDQDTDYVAPVFAPMQIVRPAPQPIVAWYAEGQTLYDANGLPRRPVIYLSWDGTKSDIRGVSYEISTSASDANVFLRGQTGDAQRGSIIVSSQAFLAGATYYARGRYIPSSPRDTPFSDWLPAILPDVKFSILDFAAEVRAEITNLNQAVTDALNSTLALITSISDNQDSADWLSRDETRIQLQAVSGALQASITHVETVATNATNALAETVDTVSVQVGDNTAAITETNTAVGAIQGQLALSYSLTLDNNGYIVGYQQTNGGPGTGTTIFTTDFFQIVGTGASPKKPFTIGTVGGVTSIGINADSVLIDGSVKATKLDVAQLSAITADFGTMTSGTIIISD